MDPLETSLPEDSRRSGTHRIRILAVDDHPLLRDGIAALVGGEDDMEMVAEASNGREAIELFRALAPDVTLMDLQMPVMDGDDATREIRRFERENLRPHTPIVALSAAVFSESVAQSLAAGCDEHIGKPVKRAMLLDAINRLGARSSLPQSSEPNRAA